MPAATVLPDIPTVNSDKLPIICVSLWRRLSAVAHAASNSKVQLNERGLLHGRPNGFGRTVVSELWIEFCDYRINVKHKPEAMYCANANWKLSNHHRNPLGAHSGNGGRTGSGRGGHGVSASVTGVGWAVVLEFPEWAT